MEATFLKSFCLLMSVAMILGMFQNFEFRRVVADNTIDMTTKLCQKLILGAPQDGPNHGLGACPNGPCAALWGPCVEDSDCMEEGNVCVDDMETCRNMVAPCCQMGEGSGEPIVEEVEE